MEDNFTLRMWLLHSRISASSTCSLKNLKKVKEVVALIIRRERFLKVKNHINPDEKPNMLIRSVLFPTTREMLSAFAFFKCAPAKPKSIMSVSLLFIIQSPHFFCGIKFFILCISAALFHFLINTSHVKEEIKIVI